MAPLPSRLATPGSIIELVHSGDRESLHWRTAPTLTLLEHVFRETNALLVNTKQAIFELFSTKAFKAALCCSPERADLKLSQEEALGWLLAHARGRRQTFQKVVPRIRPHLRVSRNLEKSSRE